MVCSFGSAESAATATADLVSNCGLNAMLWLLLAVIFLVGIICGWKLKQLKDWLRHALQKKDTRQLDLPVPLDESVNTRSGGYFENVDESECWETVEQPPSKVDKSTQTAGEASLTTQRARNIDRFCVTPTGNKAHLGGCYHVRSTKQRWLEPCQDCIGCYGRLAIV